MVDRERTKTKWLALMSAVRLPSMYTGHAPQSMVRTFAGLVSCCIVYSVRIAVFVSSLSSLRSRWCRLIGNTSSLTMKTSQVKRGEMPKDCGGGGRRQFQTKGGG